MAGRKQHYIPRVYMKGFSVQKSGRESQVYVYKSNSDVYRSSIKDVAAERDFYTRWCNDSFDLDAYITKYEENKLDCMLRILRSVNSGVVIPGLVPAETIAHLYSRTKFLRNVVGKGFVHLVDRLKGILSCDDIRNKVFNIDNVMQDSDLVHELRAVSKEIYANSNMAVPIEIIDEMLHYKIKEFLRDRNNFISIDVALSSVRSSVYDIVGGAHGKALKCSLEPNRLVDELRAFKWLIIDAEYDESYILPDCLVVTYVDSERKFLPCVMGFGDVSCIVVPISHDRIMVGYKNNLMNLGSVNNIFAACAYEFFISSVSNDCFSKLSSTIGSLVKPWVISSVDSVVDRKISETRNIKTRRVDCEAVDGPLRIHISIIPDVPLGDGEYEEFSKRISRLLETRFQIFDSSFNCNVILCGGSGIDRKAVASKYDGNIVFSFDGPYCKDCDIVVASDMNIDIYISSAIWSRFVDEKFSDDIYSEFVILRRFAEAESIVSLNICNKYGNRSECMSSDELYFQVVSSSWVSYCIDMKMASVYHEFWKQICDRFDAKLVEFGQRINESRSKFIVDGSSDVLFNEILYIATSFMVYTSRVLGVIAGAGSDFDTFIERHELLKSNGLDMWVRMFFEDISSLRRESMSYGGSLDVNVLKAHFNRLLWGCGVVILKSDAELRYVIY